MKNYLRACPRFMELERRIVPTTYNIGPSYTYHTPDAFPWNTDLVAGDEVDIHPNTGGAAYSSLIGINVSGTPASNIVIKGVTDGGSSYPTIQQHNADGHQNSDFTISVSQTGNNGQLIFEPPSGAASTAVISNLTVEYLNFVGEYNSGWQVDGIQMWRADKIHILHCSISGYSDGIFANSFGYEPGGDVIYPDIEYNRIWDNGNEGVGDDRHHDIYVSARSPIYKYNYIGEVQNGGAEIKDRSFQPTIAYNYIEGGLPLDLVDPEDGAENSLTVLTGYGTEWVYGNTAVLDPGGAKLIWFGYDASQTNAEKTLYCYLNTFLDESETASSMRMVVAGGNPATVYLSDNIYAEHNPDSSDHGEYLIGVYQTLYDTVTAHLGANVIPADASVTDSPTLVTSDGSSNLVYNDDPKFDNVSTGDFRVASNSPAVNAAKGFWTGTAFESWSTAGLTQPASEIDYSQTYPPLTFVSRSTVNTLGAWEYVATGPTAPLMPFLDPLKSDLYWMLWND